ncbi:dihydrodipicolinate synthase family protein [Reichenbachiella sp. MALMAid0571]|uniref:dihydrodipicolinate synthase family protein n=1 Tax=Reichenbachiella sp. MALMAid0571 TaxID=3143939 RepID=UPI0032E00C78
MNHKHLAGLIAAPFTPMFPDGSINPELIPPYYKMLKQNGISGAFICGSTGEGVSLTLDEKKKLAKAWGACTKDDTDFKVMMFLGGTCIADCKELAIHARECDLDAVSFTAPFYFKPASIEMLASACQEIADAVPDMPFYYYHIPVLTGVNFSMINLLETVDGHIPNFAGIKYTHEDFMDYLSCLRFRNGKYDMLWGRDENMLSALAVGTKGAVGSTYNYAAPLYLDLMDAYNKNDHEKARKLQQTSIDMIRLLGKYGGIAVGKAYMKLIGMDCGKFRLPINNMSDEQYGLFEEDARKINFQQFSSKLP